MAEVTWKPLTATEALRQFQRRGRLQLPSYSFEDWKTAAHAVGFTVAKSTWADILGDVHAAVEAAIRDGTTYEEFARRLTPLLQAKGWWGKDLAEDPKTGKDEVVQLGSPRRLRTIFDTNLRTSYAAGHWERIQRTAKARPWLMYTAVMDGRTRDPHKRWHGTILRWDHDWWNTHFPPNGWGCRCSVIQLSDAQLKRLGLTPTETPPNDGTIVWENLRTDVTEEVPKGIDPGWNYHVGKAAGPPVSTQALDAIAAEMEAHPLPTFEDLDRPKVRHVPEEVRPEAPARWPTLRDLVDHGTDETAARAEIEQRFRTLFGLEGRDSVVIPDVEGANVMVSMDMLAYALDKGQGREAFLPWVKATIEQPFEIWAVPYRRRDGSVQMRRRYIGVFRTKRTTIMVVADRIGQDWLIFNGYPHSGIDAQREGYLLYP